MKQEVIKELSTSDLQERLEEEQKQITRLKINHAVSPLENTNVLKQHRKTIARIKTEIRSREIQATKKA